MFAIEIVCSTCLLVLYWPGLQLPENKVMLEQGAEMLKGGSTTFPPAGSRLWPTGGAEHWKVLGLQSIPSVKPVSKSGGVDYVTVTLREFQSSYN